MKENSISRNKIIFSFIIFLSTSLYFIYIFGFNHITFSSIDVDDKSPGWLKRVSVPVKWPPPTILMWNKLFGESMSKKLQEYTKNMKCSYNCIYTDDRSLEQNASMLVFHIRDKLDKLPDHRTPQQLYTFFILESPPHTWDLGRDVPPDFFNISMTYRADSDVHYPYDVFEEYTKEDLERGLVSLDQIWTENEVDEKIKAKNKLALQFVSNCNTKSFREKYVEKLKNLTEITQIGTCIGGKRTCDKQCEDKLFDYHHYYFAFENSVCLNYVTEKFWKLKKLIVPVVLSRKIFKGLNIPDDSFIAADDFKSPKELIEFLKSVAADKKRYKSYFRWTKKYKKVEYENDISNPLCNLCKLAHLNTKELRIPDIKKFWDDGGSCQYGFAENVLLG